MIFPRRWKCWGEALTPPGRPGAGETRPTSGRPPPSAAAWLTRPPAIAAGTAGGPTAGSAATGDAPGARPSRAGEPAAAGQGHAGRRRFLSPRPGPSGQAQPRPRRTPPEPARSRTSTAESQGESGGRAAPVERPLPGDGREVPLYARDSASRGAPAAASARAQPPPPRVRRPACAAAPPGKLLPPLRGVAPRHVTGGRGGDSRTGPVRPPPPPCRARTASRSSPRGCECRLAAARAGWGASGRPGTEAPGWEGELRGRFLCKRVFKRPEAAGGLEGSRQQAPRLVGCTGLHLGNTSTCVGENAQVKPSLPFAVP